MTLHPLLDSLLAKGAACVERTARTLERSGVMLARTRAEREKGAARRPVEVRAASRERGFASLDAWDGREGGGADA